ncbi:hypothetical protein CRM94_22860 [Burkholderia gladioli]|uniref:Uncharacterized protein n=1 Tax=Burkholderia gladioli TaxID=28095 RepID=A0A2A7S162_BURGA|nr:hypothetical protein CEJ98_16565 [Burkholderia gladioli pv. gladioli]AWY54331.1 hypothetical protein A8H28_24560 [Burkholderia gladioli pv. gladioli]PEH37387.1 hypothetical protein CRM94_22860 [Burkholderia gladioli]
MAGDTLAAASKLCDQLNLLFMMIERGNDEGDGGDVQLLAQIGRTLTSNGYNNFGMIADQIREGGANG